MLYSADNAGSGSGDAAKGSGTEVESSATVAVTTIIHNQY
jgi:hypothetical protein